MGDEKWVLGRVNRGKAGFINSSKYDKSLRER
jgi:hypothetical protein